MKKKLLFILFSIGFEMLFAQYNFFSFTPDIGAAQMQSQFFSMECDSQYIYIIGNEVVSQDSNGRNKLIRPHFTKFDLYGKLIYSQNIPDSISDYPYVAQNFPFFKLNDSIFCYKLA